MNASDPRRATAATGTTVLPAKAAAAIASLWRQDGPPPAGPLRIWEPERVLAVCGDVHRAGPRPLRGRAAIAGNQRLLSAVIGYARILLPPLEWALDPGTEGSFPETASAPMLRWCHESTGTTVVDVLRAPTECAPLLDAATAPLVAELTEAGADAVRVVDLVAPRRTRVMTARRADSRFDQHPDLVWAALQPAPVQAGTGVA